MRVLSLVTNEESRFFRQQLTGLRGRGHEIDVVAVPGRRIDDGIDHGNRPPSAYLRFGVLALDAARGDYDLIHANYGLTAPPAVLQWRHPVVLSLWGSDLLGEYGWLTRRCARYADAVVVMSDEMASHLDRECHVVPHGIDLDRFKPEPRRTARRELGWNEDQPTVLFPYGPSREVKDYPRAARIVDRAQDELGEPIALETVTGEPHHRMPLYLNAADAMILSSKSEGSPNSVKEALACNLPVISVDVGNVRTLLEGVSHSVVDADDEVLARALAEVLRERPDSNGRERVADIALEHQLSRIEDIFRSVAPGAGGS